MLKLREWRLGIPQLSSLSRAAGRADRVLRGLCTARGLRENSKWTVGDGQSWGNPFCLECLQTVEHRPGRKLGQQKPWLENQGGLASGSVDVGYTGNSLHSTVPGFLALEQQARAASSALFRQPEVPPSLSESNDFLKMDSVPSPSCN